MINKLMRRAAILLFLLTVNFILSPAAWSRGETTGLAVMDFQFSGGNLEDRDMGRVVAEMFITSLVRDDRFEIVEHDALKKVLEEQALAMSGITDLEAAAKAGRVLGVRALVAGTVARLDGSWEVNARCIDTETASILAAESAGTESDSGLQKLADELAVKLVDSVLPIFRTRNGDSGRAGGRGGIKNVYGLVGSEKVSIFQDPRTNKVLQGNGFSVSIDWAGSRRMETGSELDKYDFAFPSGIENAAKISQAHGVHDYHVAFFTPMVVASWKPVADILEANNVVRKDEGVYFLDMANLLDLIKKKKKWSDLNDNSGYRVDKDILITSTDLRTSNSAAMYLSIAAFIENDNSVPTSKEEIREIIPLMRRLFLAQGSQPASSREPFNDYLLMGMGKSPLVMVYESQFLEAAGNSSLSPDMVMLYPVPTIYVKAVVVPLTEAGDQLGRFIKNNREFNQLALEHGMHTDDSAGFAEFVENLGLTLPGYLVDVINPPEYDILNGMIESIYQSD